MDCYLGTVVKVLSWGRQVCSTSCFRFILVGRQTNRQTDKQTNRQTDKQIGRQTNSIKPWCLVKHPLMLWYFVYLAVSARRKARLRLFSPAPSPPFHKRSRKPQRFDETKIYGIFLCTIILSSIRVDPLSMGNNKQQQGRI